MRANEVRTKPPASPAGDISARLGSERPVQSFQDILDLSLAMIEAQRTRVARALREEAGTGGLDKTLSVEIKRLNAMLATYNDLVSTPQAKAGAKPRAGTGAVSQVLSEVLKAKGGSRR